MKCFRSRHLPSRCTCSHSPWKATFQLIFDVEAAADPIGGVPIVAQDPRSRAMVNAVRPAFEQLEAKEVGHQPAASLHPRT